MTRKDPGSEWLARDNPETHRITIKPEAASHVAEQLSWVPLPYCSPPRRPFPIRSLASSARVSPRTIHFRVLDKSPLSGPGRRPPSSNNSIGFHVSQAERPCLEPLGSRSQVKYEHVGGQNLSAEWEKWDNYLSDFKYIWRFVWFGPFILF